MSLVVRPAIDADYQFILAAWVSSLLKSDYAGMIAESDWARVMRPQVDRVIRKLCPVVLVAADTDASPGVADLYGFVAADPAAPLVGYVYVKSAYRRHGVARRLLRSAGIDPLLPFDFVCRTVFVDTLSKSIPHGRFRPVIARKA